MRGYLRIRQANDYRDAIDLLHQSQNYSDDIDLMKTRISLLGQSEADQNKIIAMTRLEQDLARRGSALTDEEKQKLRDQTAALNDMNAAYQNQLEMIGKIKDATTSISDMSDEAADDFDAGLNEVFS